VILKTKDHPDYQVLLTSLVTFFEIFKLVSVSAAALVEEPLAALRLHVEVEQRLQRTTSIKVISRIDSINFMKNSFGL
jgi:hypothetical protein